MSRLSHYVAAPSLQEHQGRRALDFILIGEDGQQEDVLGNAWRLNTFLGQGMQGRGTEG